MFFDSLYDKNTNRFGPNIAGIELANQATSIIVAGLSEIENKQNGLSIIDQALDFLNKIIISSRKDEINWLQQHLFNNKDIPEEIIKNAEKFFEDFNSNQGTINYLEFITYFNTCLIGLEEYQQNLEYEQKRLEELKEIWNKLEKLDQTKRNKITKQAKRNLQENNKTVDDDSILAESFTIFVKQQLNQDKDNQKYWQNILNSSTIINKIATVLDDIFKKIWYSPEMKTEFANILQMGSPDELNEVGLAYLISTLAMESKSEIIKIIEEEINSNTDKEQEFIQSKSDKLIYLFLDKLGPLDEEEIIEDHAEEMLLTMLIKEIKQIQNDSEQTQLMMSKIFTKLKIKGKDVTTDQKINGSRSTIVGLTKEVLDILEPMLSALLNDPKREKKYGRKRSGKNAPTRRARVIGMLQELLKTGYQNPNSSLKIAASKKVTYEGIARLARRLLKQSNAIQVHFNSRSNILSELQANRTITQCIKYDQLANKFLNTMNLTKNYNKADISLFELGEAIISTDIQNKFNILAEQIIKEISSSPHLKSSELKFSNKAIKKDKQLRDEKNFTSTEFFLEGETQKRLIQWQEMTKQLSKKAEKNSKEGEAARKTLESLKKSFKISTSVKSYDKYNNSKGFTGGSLGGSLEHQIENIQQMFKIGGITEFDVDWLLFSIYNAGEELVGKPYKKDLEDFLSIFAVSMMFEDIGEQATYIKQQAEQMDKITPQFLHLYLLNGIYFPSSYILQLTYDNLMKIYNKVMLTTNQLSSGSTVSIQNNITHADLVGTNTIINEQGEKETTSRIYTTSPQDWYDTFTKNKDKVNLQVHFLAGFLDILAALEQFSFGPN